MGAIGIDPSLTSTGIAYTDEPADSVSRIVAPKGLTGYRRIRFIRDSVREIVDYVRPEIVGYEGYAMGRFVGKIFDRAELGGVLKLELFERKIPILLVPPNSLKLFATGKGNADKDDVRVAMGFLRGVYFSSDDEADAYALLQMAYQFCDPRLRPRNVGHFKRVAVDGCILVAGDD